MWWRTRHGRGPPARHHLLEQLPGPAEHPCRVPLAAAHTPGTAPFSRPGLNTHARSGEEPFKRSGEAQNPRSHKAPASLQRSRTQIIVHGNLTLGSQVQCPRTMITRRSGVRAQTITILRCPGTNGHNAAVSAHNDHPTAGGGVPFRVISRCSSPWGGCCWLLAGTGQGGRAAPAACRRCCAAPAATEPPGSVSAVRDGEPGQGLPLGGESRSSGRATGLTEQWASRSRASLCWDAGWT
jgi:hypothetical protein